jgi:hypothetical protein
VVSLTDSVSNRLSSPPAESALVLIVIMIVMIIIIMLVAVPIAFRVPLIVPAAPPRVILIPATFSHVVQVPSAILGFAAMLAMSFDRSVKLRFGLFYTLPALVSVVVRVGAWGCNKKRVAR